MRIILLKGNEVLDIQKDFGIRVKELRNRCGMSQEELALLSDLDRSYIGGVERGARNISLQNIEKSLVH